MLRGNNIRLTREGFGYLVILAFVVGGALLRDINLLIVVAGIMFGLFLLNAISVMLMLGRLRLERKHPEVVSAGDLLVVDLTLTNPRWRLCSWAVAVEDPIQRINSARDETARGRVFFPCVRPRQPAHAAYRGRIANRGRYTFGPAKLTTRFPTGLVRRTKRVHVTSEITVFPRTGELLPAWYKIVTATQAGSQRSRSRQGLLEGEFHGLREWRSGDSRSWIHWRTSAKRGNLTVRQFERHENQDIMILLDLWQDRSPSAEQLRHVETAVSFAATIVAEQCRRGSSQLKVGTAGKEIKFASGVASMVTVREIMEMLATSDAGHSDRLPAMLDEALSSCRPQTRVVIIGTRRTELTDTERFAHVWDDLDKRALLGRIFCFDVADAETANYFRQS